MKKEDSKILDKLGKDPGFTVPENYFANSLRTVAKSREIGEIVLEKLREIDPIAYIRFASVYEDFTDIESFVSVIRDLENKKETETSEKKVGEEKKNG